MDLGSAVSLSTATGSGPREIPFNAVRLRYDSNESFDEVLSSLLADVGDKPLHEVITSNAKSAEQATATSLARTRAKKRPPRKSRS